MVVRVSILSILVSFFFLYKKKRIIRIKEQKLYRHFFYSPHFFLYSTFFYTYNLGVDGHTVLRYVSDIYTDTILRFAKTINSQTKSIFHSHNSQDNAPGRRGSAASATSQGFDSNPRRLEWKMTPKLTLGVRFAETRLSDLILQNEVKVLEFNNYGKYFITDMKMSPDAFVQVLYYEILLK